MDLQQNPEPDLCWARTGILRASAPRASDWIRVVAATAVSRLTRRSVNSPKGDFQKLQKLSINSPSPADEANQRFPAASRAKPERFCIENT